MLSQKGNPATGNFFAIVGALQRDSRLRLRVSAAPAAIHAQPKPARATPALRALGVRSLALFGSAARGQARQDSDLDFLVIFDQPNFDGYMDVKFRLEEIFSRRVDLVLESALKPALRQQVLAEAIHAPGF